MAATERPGDTRHPSEVTQPSEEELARRAQAGCLASFELLVRRLQVPLVHFLRRRTSLAEADDLAQETFLRAFENLQRYDHSYRFRPWLFTIAHRLSINASRRTRPDDERADLDHLADQRPSPAELADAEEQREQLWQTAMDLLGAVEVTALWLYYAERMTTEEIGRVVGRSRSAVKTMLHRARRRLADALPSNIHEKVS